MCVTQYPTTSEGHVQQPVAELLVTLSKRDCLKATSIRVILPFVKSEVTRSSKTEQLPPLPEVATRG